MEANEIIFLSADSPEMKHGSIQFDPENKIQSKEWHPKGASGPVKFKAERSVKKVMATIFWDCEGVILIDFLKGKKTVTSSYYKDALKKLKTSLAKNAEKNCTVRFCFITTMPPAHSSRAVWALLCKF